MATPLVEIADIAPLSRGDDRPFVPIAQFVKDWNRDPSRRTLMIDSPPTLWSREHRTALAAIVRCLCARDSHPIPRWARTVEPLSAPYSLSGVDLESKFGHFVRANTSGLAAALNVFFDRSLLEST